MRQELMEGKSPGADGTVSKTGWSNKGNNKITELRTILQRESQNS